MDSTEKVDLEEGDFHPPPSAVLSETGTTVKSGDDVTHDAGINSNINPPRTATFKLPTSATFGLDGSRDDRNINLTREKTLEATQSIGGLSTARARRNLDPRPRVAAEFRTMSVQLSQGGLAAPDAKKRKGKKDAKKHKGE